MTTGAEWDVAIIGGGLAGLSAALEARAAGARTLLLEREIEWGGNSAISAGLIALCDTVEQRAAGVRDSATTLFDDLHRTGGGASDPALLHAYAHGQADLKGFLSRHGICSTGLEQGAGQSVPRAHQFNAREAVNRLLLAAREAGVTMRTGCRVRRLWKEEGAIRLDDGPSARAVVLATGGFALADDLLATFAPSQTACLRVGASGSHGDGLRMGWALGADLRDMGSIKGTFGAHPDSGGTAYHALLTFYVGGIAVNREGRRFANEEQPYKLLGEACLRQPGATAFQVFDHAIMQRSDPAVPLCDSARQHRAGRVIEAATWEALAQECGMVPGVLAQTVDDYNCGVATGQDAWGRQGLCAGTGSLVPLKQPPFYAFPCGTALLATYCGLRMDATGQVIDVFGDAIPGLFAAGEVAGGFHGTAYMTGAALGAAAFFGREAGRSAAHGALQR